MWCQVCLADELLPSIGYGTYNLSTHPAKVSSKRRSPSLILSWERWGRGYLCDHLLLMMDIWRALMWPSDICGSNPSWAAVGKASIKGSTQTGLTCLPSVTDIPSLWCWTWGLRSTLITWERKDLWRARDLQHYKSESRWTPAVSFQALPELLLKETIFKISVLWMVWDNSCC